MLPAALPPDTNFTRINSFPPICAFVLGHVDASDAKWRASDARAVQRRGLIRWNRHNQRRGRLLGNRGTCGALAPDQDEMDVQIRAAPVSMCLICIPGSVW